MPKQIIIVNGYPESGKDTFVRHCWTRLTITDSRPVFEYDSVGKYKEVLKRYFGWDGIEKNAVIRSALAYMKTLDMELSDGPFNDFGKFVNATPDNAVIFTYIREPEEIQRLTDAGAISVLVHRGSADGKTYSNPADEDVGKFQYQHYILNIGSHDDLRLESYRFVEQNLLNRLQSSKK